jgi:predicted nucleic acid-binding protein
VSEFNVVDSSGWLEYLADTDRASLYSAAIEDTPNLIVPAICVYEVYKKFRRERGDAAALEAVGLIIGAQVVELDLELALAAARYNLPLADSIIYATAVRYGATLWTQDEHFDGLDSVQYFPKPASP